MTCKRCLGERYSILNKETMVQLLIEGEGQFRKENKAFSTIVGESTDKNRKHPN